MRPKHHKHIGEHEALLSEGLPEQDQEYVTKYVGILRGGNFLSHFSSPGWLSCLALSSDDARDASTQTLGNLNIIAALMLSSILGNALSPITNETKPNLAFAFNLVQALMVVICATTTLFTVYFNCGLFTLRGTDVYKAVLNCHFSALWYFTTLLSGVFTMVLMILAAFLKLDQGEATTITIISMSVFLFLFGIFGEAYCDMFTLEAQFWSPFCAPWKYFSNWVNARPIAERIADSMASNLKQHDMLQTGGDSLSIDTFPAPRSARSSKESFNEEARRFEYDAFLHLLQDAFPNQDLSKLRGISQQFMADDLTVDALRKAASCGNQFLWQVLSQPRLGLTSGNRIDLVCKLAPEENQGRPTAGRSLNFSRSCA